MLSLTDVAHRCAARFVAPLPECRRAFRAVLVVAVTCLTFNSTAWAQKPPQLGYAFPPVIRAGQTTEVRLGGFDLTPDMQWFVHTAGIRLHTSGVPGDYQLTPPPYWTGPRAGVGALPVPREVVAQLEVDATLAPGPVRWQVANANGTSQTAVLYVSHETEVVEHRSGDLPQTLPQLPLAVSGRLSRLAEVDRYQFMAPADGPVSVELMARRLGSNLNMMAQVQDADGLVLAEFADTQGSDGGLTFSAVRGRIYTLALHDTDFRGDRSFVYRAVLTAAPRVVATLPAHGQRGTTGRVEFVGWGVVTGQPVLERIQQEVQFPSDPAVAVHTHPLQTPFGTTPVPIPLSDLTELPHWDPKQELPAPCAVTNVLPSAQDRQQFTWNVRQGEFWRIELRSRAVGGSLDVALSVLDAEGKVVVENDDISGSTDSAVDFQAASSGLFTCVVKSVVDRTNRLDELYRLQLLRVRPDFSLTIPQQLSVPLGGKFELPVQVQRAGGHDTEITLQLHGLPTGVQAVGDLKVPSGKNEFKIPLAAAADADVTAVPIRLSGSAEINGALVMHEATALAAGNLAPRSPEEQRLGVALLAVTMTPPFQILLIDRTRQRDVPRGSVCVADLEIVREPGFQGAVSLEMAAQQARYLCGSHGLSVVVPPGETRAQFGAWMSEWLSTDFTMRMATHGVASVSDPKGRLRSLVRATDAPITMIMEGALLKLTVQQPERVFTPGESVVIPVTVSRSPRLSLPVTVTVAVPEELQGLIQFEPLELSPETSRGELRGVTTADAKLQGAWNFVLRAKALQEERWPVVSEDDLTVVFE